MNRYEYGKVLNILKMNEPIPGAAITEPFNERSVIYSLGKGTDVEAESFHQYHILLVAQGKIECYALNERGIQNRWTIRQGGMTMLPKDMPVGVNALEDSVYIRISAVRKEDIDPQIEQEKEYLLTDLMPYVDQNVNIVRVIFNEQMRVTLMSMDENTSYVPDVSINSGIFAREGCFDITYDGDVSTVHEGEAFVAKKGHRFEIHAGHGRVCVMLIQNAL